MRHLRQVLALGAFFVVMVGLTACGGGVPSNSVAKVGDSDISKATFQHWLAIVAKGSAATPGAKVSIPDAPDFTQCIAEKKKTTPKPPKGQPKPTASQFKRQCEQQYQGLRDQAMNFLIQAQWIQGEAADQGVKITDAEVQKQFQRTKKQAFPKQKDFQRFLKQSGMTLDDILFRVRIDTLSNKLRAKITKDATKMTDKDVAAYYNSHKAQFATPERRDLLIVLTKNKAKAQAALKALKGGASFKTVAKQYSIDQQTKATGGLLQGVVKGQQDRALDQAAFSAPTNKLLGPIKAQFGYYLVKVKKVTAKDQQSLAQAKASIKQQLIAQRQQKALNDFITDFRKKWTEKTDCRKGFVVQGCKEAPKAKPGAAPQGAAPPGGSGGG